MYSTKIQKPSLSNSEKNRTQELTFGQKLADSMAAKVGSWIFLIGQTTILTGWVTANLIPGIPHWDEPPFILLNLFFSFASAYTAPIVLMSQNRQSDEDRQQATQNHQVNLQTAYNIELLQQKIDELNSQNRSQLLELIKQQQAVNSNQTNIPVSSTVDKKFKETDLLEEIPLANLNTKFCYPLAKPSFDTNTLLTFYCQNQSID